MLAPLIYLAVNLCPAVNAPVYGTLPVYDESKVCSLALLEAGCPGCSQAIQWDASGGDYEQMLRCDEVDRCVIQGNTAHFNHYALVDGHWTWDRVISYWYPSWDVEMPVAGAKYHYWHRPCQFDTHICTGPWLGVDDQGGGVPYVSIETACYEQGREVACYEGDDILH